MANKKVVPGSLTEAYRKGQGDFSPDLVGFQLTKGTPLFTLGNFGVTTNLDPKPDTEFNTGVYSNEFTLENLDLTEQQSLALVSNSIYTTLNLDPNDLSRFVYYGSFVQFLRVSLEGAIGKWKGSLYITDDEGGYSTVAKNTLLGYSYNSLTDESEMTIPTLFVENKFNLITNDLGGFILDPTEISNIKLSYTNYEISNDYGSFELLGYTGDTKNIPGVTDNPYIKVTVKGEAFPTLTGSSFGTFKYHLKPKDTVVDRLFFDTLSEFENILLNRLVTPKYTSMFESPVETESGTLLSARKSFTWPTTDGFNLDIDTIEYGSYIDNLLKMGLDYDRLKSNLMTRRFVSQSIQEYDTDDGTDDESQGRKINKLLKIYGREYDEVKKYTDGIQFANVVTYNKRDNTPDELIKNMAKTLGFETIKSVSDNKLITYIAKSNQAVFEGQSRSMSIQEIDTELWRRLVINAWWLYKSKGTRKVIEFFIKLFGLGECLVNFDECVYVADNKLDVEATFNKVEEILSLDAPSGTTVTADRDLYPIDEQGFPRTLPNTQEYYFQMNGFWYNNGTQRTTGNNPHYGPYDYGSKYFERFTCFVDDFSGRTDVTLQEYIDNTNLFPDYNKGDLEITFEDGKPLMDYGDTYAQIMEDNDRVSEMTNLFGAGFSTERSRTGRGSLKLSFSCGDDDCDVPCPNFVIDQETGLILVQPSNPKLPATEQMSEECCVYHGFEYGPTTISELYKKSLSKEALELVLKYEELIKKKYYETIGTTACFWCPPATIICDFQIYIEILIKTEGVEGLVDLLISEGIIGPDKVEEFITLWNTDQRELLAKIIKWFNNRYEGYCVVAHDDFKEIKSEQCCKIRGGEWTRIDNKTGGTPRDEKANSDDSSVSISNAGTWKCVIPKEVPPEPDPCVCELPEYCDYKPTITVYTNGFSYLDCGVPVGELENYSFETSEAMSNWRAQRDAYLKAQFTSILGGGTPGSTVPFTPIPTPVPGMESWTGYDTWRFIEYTDGCYDEYYGWVSDGGFNDDGQPTGSATAPCAFEECDGLTDGTVYTTDYEDITTTNRQKRDAAVKAKNEMSLAFAPFVWSNDSIPYFQINKCKSDCGKECTECSGTVTLDPPCPSVDEISLQIFRGITFINNVNEKCCNKDIVGPLTGTPPIWGNPYPTDPNSKVGCWVDFQINSGGDITPTDNTSTTSDVIRRF